MRYEKLPRLSIQVLVRCLRRSLYLRSVAVAMTGKELFESEIGKGPTAKKWEDLPPATQKWYEERAKNAS